MVLEACNMQLYDAVSCLVCPGEGRKGGVLSEIRLGIEEGKGGKGTDKSSIAY